MGLSKKMKALSTSGLDFSLLCHYKSFCNLPFRNHFFLWKLSTWAYSSKVIRLLVNSLTVSTFGFWKSALNHSSQLIMREHRMAWPQVSITAIEDQGRPMTLQTLIPEGSVFPVSSIDINLDISSVPSSLCCK